MAKDLSEDLPASKPRTPTLETSVALRREPQVCTKTISSGKVTVCAFGGPRVWLIRNNLFFSEKQFSVGCDHGKSELPPNSCSGEAAGAEDRTLRSFKEMAPPCKGSDGMFFLS